MISSESSTIVNDLKDKNETEFKELLSTADEDKGWDLIKNANEVIIHKKRKENSPVHCVRGKGRIKASAEEIGATVRAIDFVSDWDPFYRSGRVVESPDKDHDIIHCRYSLDTPLVSDREFVYLENRRRYDDGKIVVLAFSIPREDIALLPGCVRGEVVTTGFVIVPSRPTESEKKVLEETESKNEFWCEVTYVVQVDPKGWLPTWLVNFMAGNEPLCLDRIRTFIKENRDKLPVLIMETQETEYKEKKHNKHHKKKKKAETDTHGNEQSSKVEENEKSKGNEEENK